MEQEAKARERIDWTPELVAKLKKLHAAELSFSQIAEKLGMPGQKNAMIGKATRLKLPKRHDAFPRLSAKEKLEQSKKAVAAKREAARLAKEAKAQAKAISTKPRDLPITDGFPVEADLRFLRSDAWKPLEGSNPVPLVDLERHQCNWPLGTGPYLFCALPTEQGARYCNTHTHLSKPRT